MQILKITYNDLLKLTSTSNKYNFINNSWLRFFSPEIIFTSESLKALLKEKEKEKEALYLIDIILSFDLELNQKKELANLLIESQSSYLTLKLYKYILDYADIDNLNKYYSIFPETILEPLIKKLIGKGFDSTIIKIFNQPFKFIENKLKLIKYHPTPEILLLDHSMEIREESKRYCNLKENIKIKKKDFVKERIEAFNDFCDKNKLKILTNNKSFFECSFKREKIEYKFSINFIRDLSYVKLYNENYNPNIFYINQIQIFRCNQDKKNYMYEYLRYSYQQDKLELIENYIYSPRTKLSELPINNFDNFFNELILLFNSFK